MAGKLLYSRVLQNRLAKNQGSQGNSLEQGATVAAKPPQQQYYSSAASYNDYPVERRPAYDHASSYPDDRYGKTEGNKIRRGPGRRLAKEKEKRMRSMDPALMQKYASLPESMQEKVNATIEICYQQHMARLYKNPGKDDEDDSHYDQDIEIHPDEAIDADSNDVG